MYLLPVDVHGRFHVHAVKAQHIPPPTLLVHADGRAIPRVAAIQIPALIRRGAGRIEVQLHRPVVRHADRPPACVVKPSFRFRRRGIRRVRRRGNQVELPRIQRNSGNKLVSGRDGDADFLQRGNAPFQLGNVVADRLCIRRLALFRQRRVHFDRPTAGTAVLRHIVSRPASHKAPSGCQRYHLRPLLRLQYAAQRAGHCIYTLRQYGACHIARSSTKHRNRFAISAVKGCRNLIRGQIHRCTAVVHTDAPFVRTAVTLHHHQVRPASRPGRMLEVNALLKRPLHCFSPPACG